MKNGTFINYQMAEAINMIDNSPPDQTLEESINSLKSRWEHQDTIPGYNKKIGYMPGMESLTLENVYTLREEAQKVDTYTTQNCAAMQYCIQFDENGKFKSFDFSKLEQIVALAKRYNKNIIIDSAVVFGDIKNNNLKNLTKEEIKEVIRIYISTLTTQYGEYIERIDVFNAIYQRNVIDNENPSEIFWVETFGPYYLEQIIKLVRESINPKYKDQIKLCWNEFFLTNPEYASRKNEFLEMIKKIDIDVIGVQDRFMIETPLEYTRYILHEIANVCHENGKSVAITELSCSVNRHSREHLPTEQINESASQIIQTVKTDAQNNNAITSVEGASSDQYDYNHQELITNKNYPRDISTTGKKEIARPPQEHNNELSSMFTEQSVSKETPRQEQTHHQEKPKVKTLGTQNNNGFTNYMVLLISSILCILITMIIFILLK